MWKLKIVGRSVGFENKVEKKKNQVANQYSSCFWVRKEKVNWPEESCHGFRHRGDFMSGYLGRDRESRQVKR